MGEVGEFMRLEESAKKDLEQLAINEIAKQNPKHGEVLGYNDAEANNSTNDKFNGCFQNSHDVPYTEVVAAVPYHARSSGILCTSTLQRNIVANDHNDDDIVN